MTDVAPPNPAEDNEPAVSVKTRAALTLLALLAMFGVAVSQPSGPVLRGTVAANGTAGNLTYTYAQPSPGVSPVSAGKLDVATTDGTGVLWTRIVSAANVTLPASSPVPVQGTLPSGSPVGTLPLLPVLVAPSPPFIGDGAGLYVQGLTDHNSAVITRPVLVSGSTYATGSLPTAVGADTRAARLLVDRYGRARVSLESSAGISIPGDENGLRVITMDNAGADGHSTVFEAQCTGGTAESTAKASAGLLKWIHVSNPNTSDVFLQIFDASNPTPGSTTPTMIFTIPGGSSASNRGVYNQEFGPVGVTFSTAITYTITTTATGGTAPAANCTTGFGYK